MDEKKEVCLKRLQDLQAANARRPTPSNIGTAVVQAARAANEKEAVRIFAAVVGAKRRWMKRSPDLSIKPEVTEHREKLTRDEKQLGQINVAWIRHMPKELVDHTRIKARPRRGILTVFVDSSSVLFEIDRVLREGKFKDIQKDFRGSLIAIKLKLEASVSRPFELRQAG